jgi:hypothetical protein
MQFGVLQDKAGANQWAVLESKTAFDLLMKKLGGKAAKLIIKKA